MNIKKYLKKALVSALCLTTALGTFACGGEDTGKHPILPDYQAEDYTFFSYSAPNTGVYTIDGVKREIGPDLRTKEGYTTYKEAGFNTLMLGGTNDYGGGGWEGTEAWRCVRAAEEAGIEKVIIKDARFNSLIELKDALIGDGENCQFANEEELTAYVKECMTEYASDPMFGGMQIRDEPDCTYMKSLGYVYKAIKKAGEELGLGNVYINLNLLPLGNSVTKYDPEASNLTDAYTNYVEGYLDATGADRINCDVYMFRGSGICDWFFQTAQIIRAACDERGVEMSFCLQSFELYSGSNLIYREVGKSEMLMERYTLMGMGVNNFAYYTYMCPESTSTVNPYIEGTSFLKRSGEKTNVYYYGQHAMQTAQKSSDIVRNFKFKGGNIFLADMPNFDVACYMTSRACDVTKTTVKYDTSYEFELLEDVNFDNDVTYVTELYDETNALYMYMLQNAVDPLNGQYGRTAETIKATFPTEYTWVAELHEGELSYVKLKKGVYEKTLSAGDAVFVIPLK